MNATLHQDLPMPCHREIELFRNHFAEQGAHPCLAARTVLDTDQAQFEIYSHLGSFYTARKMMKDIMAFFTTFDLQGDAPYSFVALFKGEEDYNEMTFELLMWQQLQALQQASGNNGWSNAESDYHEEADFSFNIAGHAFHVVGMHPQRACLARRAPMPAMVFNLHSYFKKLREEQVSLRIRNRIKQRDRGSVTHTENKAIGDFGPASRAYLFSGQQVPAPVECPFHASNSSCPLSEEIDTQ